jgi:hypothetical protein
MPSLPPSPGLPSQEQPDASARDTDQPIGSSGDLALRLLSASMGANFDTMDRLYESERNRRRALEVHLDNALAAFERAHLGSVREYEAAVALLRRIPVAGREMDDMAARHPENDAS